MTAELHRIAQVAMHSFQRNADTMVAGFLVRNPDIDPADVDLVMTQDGGSVRFSIQPKELYVPQEKHREMVGPEHELEEAFHYSAVNSDEERAAYDAGEVDGWNACRQAMIDATKKARPDGAMVATLDTMLDQIAAGVDGKPVEIHRG